MSGRRSIWIVAFAVGCGASTGAPTTLPEPPAAATRATLVGPRCAAGACTCREPEVEADEEAPPPGRKRYEVRLGPSDNELWATIGDHQLYKSRERASACFYLDLDPGEHPVTIRAHQVGGFAARVEVKELSGGGPWWYDTLTLDCDGQCSDGALRDWKASLARFANQVHDPCGSTKVQHVTWATARMPESVQPDDLTVELVLRVYKFATAHRTGSAECGKR